jgi:hypothetical protein
MRVALVAVLPLCAVACAAQRHTATTTPTRLVRHGAAPAWLLAGARRAARSLGDPHPEKIELFAIGKSYKIRLWGSFRCDACSRPYGAAAITGQVATFVYRGHSDVLSSFSLARRRIVLAADRTAPVIRDWRNELARAARKRPRRRFASPPLPVLRARLADAARRYGFTVDRIELRRPVQLAPQITIRGAPRAKLARSLGSILDVIDPPAHSNDRAYEGILLEAVDAGGVPFAIAWNSLRWHVAGGQWAAAPNLYPFPHG